MLLTKMVKVKWNPANRKWYEFKGYKFTKWKDEFKIKVEDLSKGSKIKIQVKCDGENCNEILSISWNSYINHTHDGKYYCKKCSINLIAKENMKKTKLKHGQSFYDWCYENLNKKQADEIINRWDYNLNKCSPKEVCYGSHEKYWFTCPQKIHESELKNLNGFTNKSRQNIKGLNCNQCNSFAQWGIDNLGKDFLEKYWDYKKNNKLGLDPWKINHGNNKKVWIKCQEKSYHDSYLVSCLHFTNSNSRCPYCCNHHGKVHPKDSLGQYIIDNYGQDFLNKIWSNKNKKSSFQYPIMSNQKVWWKCPDGKHNDFYKSIENANKCNFRCPKCVKDMQESILQKKVRKYLESLNYEVLHEYNCILIPINPKTKYLLPFDNEVINLNLIIEVNGLQHYKVTKFHQLAAKHNNTTPEYELHYQQLKDRYKKFIAYKKGYKYLAIPYWTDDKNETWKKLINNKVNEIIKNNDINKILLENKQKIEIKKEKTKKVVTKSYNLEIAKNKIKNFKKENFKGINNPRAKKIICLNTKEIFDYMKQACKKYNIDPSNITKCCKRKVNFAGRDPLTKEFLKWAYYDEYIEKNIYS